MGRGPRAAQGTGAGALSKDGSLSGKPATKLVAAGRRREWAWPLVNPPVWRGSTVLYDDAADHARGRRDEDGQFYYGRRGGPTQWALCEALTQLEPGATGTMLYPSGLAAIAGTLQAVLKAGDRLALTDNCYQPTREFADGFLTRLGVETIYFDPLDHVAFADIAASGIAAAFLECPGSLTMEVCDVPALAAIAHRHGACVLLDNTWASSLGFPALEKGVDIAIMSLTKHVGGHSDLLMGSASAGPEYYARLRESSNLQGQYVSPDDAALALRGLRTMQLRTERSAASALAIARWLDGRDEVARVLFPILPGSLGHDIWQSDFTGGCGLLSFVLRGRDRKARDRFFDALELFRIGYSWGGYESLVTPIDAVRLRQVLPWPMDGCGPDDVVGIRLAVGLEDSGDLIADLEQGLVALEL